MDKKVFAIGLVVVFAIVAVFIGIYAMDNPERDPPFDKTGDWYLVYEENVSIKNDPENPLFEVKDYDMADKKAPLVIRWVDERMFAADWNGTPILGGVVSNKVCFEVSDEDTDVNAYVEGTMNGKILFLSIVYFSDAKLDTVVGGSYQIYGHKTLGDLQPSRPSFVQFPYVNPKNGTGAYYYLDDQNALQKESYVPQDIELVDQKYNTSVVKSTVTYGGTDAPDHLYSVCIFVEENDARMAYLMSGSSQGRVYSGSLTLADDKLQVSLNIHAGTLEAQMSYAIATYDVNFHHGDSPTSTDVTGTWQGYTIYSYGDEVIEGTKLVTKTMSFNEPVFACVEPISDNVAYKWIGTVFNGGMYAVAEHEGYNYNMFGVVHGDKMYVSGFYIDETGKYMSVYYELTRVA